MDQKKAELTKPTEANSKVDMSKIRKCNRCGRLFKVETYVLDLCPFCVKIDNEDFEKVREYLYEHNTATAIELSEATGVSIEQIERYLKNGRLEIPENSPIFIKCERCGAEIRSGRLCSDCSLSLSNSLRMQMNFTDAQIGEKPKNSVKHTDAKMHFLDAKVKTKKR